MSGGRLKLVYEVFRDAFLFCLAFFGALCLFFGVPFMLIGWPLFMMCPDGIQCDGGTPLRFVITVLGWFLCVVLGFAVSKISAKK